MILSHDVDASRLTIRTDQGLIALEPRSARTIRIRYTREDELSRKPSLTVTPPPADALPVAFRVEDLPEALVLSTDALSIAIDRQTAAFTYRDSAGGILTREPARGGKTLDAIDVLVSVFDEAAVVESRTHADGVRIETVDVPAGRRSPCVSHEARVRVG